MPALYYAGYLIDAEATKSRAPRDRKIYGAQVYASQVVPALLRYGSFDTYIFPRPQLLENGKRESSLAEAAPDGHSYRSTSARQIAYVDESVPFGLAEFEDIVFFSPGPYLRKLCQLRRRVGRSDIPVSGIFHSLNHLPALEEVALDFLEVFQPWDVMFASSMAGADAYRRRADFVGKELGKRLYREGNSPCLHLVPLGISTESEPPNEEFKKAARMGKHIPEDTICILYFGRLSVSTKADLAPLVMAVETLICMGLDVNLVIAGDDTTSQYGTELLALGQLLGIAKQLWIFSDPTAEEKTALFAAADIFVAPSDCIQETFGITLLEAMAAGLPVVASDWSGYRDIVVPEETGFLIPTAVPDFRESGRSLVIEGTLTAEDLLARLTMIDQNSLVTALRNLVVNRDLRQRLGINGRRRVESHFTWPIIIKQYEEAWCNSIEASKFERHRGRRQKPVDLSSYPYREIFDSFPTGWIDAHTQIRLTQMGIVASHDPARLKISCRRAGWFDESLLSSILQLLESERNKSIADVEGELTADVFTARFAPLTRREIIQAHCCRLIKYGFVTYIQEG